MRNAFHRVVLSMCPIVHRVELPAGPGAVMRRLMQDAIHDRVTHVDVRVRHVDLSPQHARTTGDFAVFHALGKVMFLSSTPFGLRGVLARSVDLPRLALTCSGLWS